MEKQKNSVGKTVLIILLLIVTIVSLVLATYAWAKYTSTTNGTAKANVAKWNVTFSSNQNEFVGKYKHVTNGTIAPGTSGSFDIVVNPNNTETCFNYTIKISDIKFLNNEEEVVETLRAADEANNVQAITASDLLSHITIKCGDTVLQKSSEITGTYNLGETNHNATTGTMSEGTKTISWEWAFEDEPSTAAYDEIDTAAGNYAAGNGLKLQIDYTITAVQVNPANATH